MLDTLQEADFEPIAVDGNGRFSFSSALQKLRRSIVGLHNKIFPVYVANDVANPVPVQVANTAVTNAIQAQADINADGATTLYTVPAGYSFYLTDAVISYGVAGTQTMIIAAGGNNILRGGCNLGSATNPSHTRGAPDLHLRTPIIIAAAGTVTATASITALGATATVLITGYLVAV